MSLTWATWMDQYANLLVYNSTDSTFTDQVVPGAIDYGEGRLYRELDLLAMRVTSSGALTANTRDFTLPTQSGTYLVVESLNVITPATATAATGTRKPVVPVAREWVDAVYPSNNNAAGVPEYFSRVDNTQIILGPSPDAAYPVEVIGTQQPTALSSTNTTTILTTMLPDLWMAATMVYGAAFQRDFGAQTDDPAKAQSWEGQYTKLMESAAVTEFRKKYQSQAWTSQMPNQTATPQRV